MISVNCNKKGFIRSVNVFSGESLERRIERLLKSGEPIESIAPMIYTEKKEGVRVDTNIRTDRFDLALESMDKIDKSRIVQRDNVVKDNTEQGDKGTPIELPE